MSRHTTRGSDRHWLLSKKKHLWHLIYVFIYGFSLASLWKGLFIYFVSRTAVGKRAERVVLATDSSHAESPMFWSVSPHIHCGRKRDRWVSWRPPHLEKNESIKAVYRIWCPVIFFPCISNIRSWPRMFLINHNVRHYSECERKRQQRCTHWQACTTPWQKACVWSVHAQQAITAACSGSSLAFPPSQWLAVMWLMTVICWALFAPWLVPKRERESGLFWC